MKNKKIITTLCLIIFFGIISNVDAGSKIVFKHQFFKGLPVELNTKKSEALKKSGASDTVVEQTLYKEYIDVCKKSIKYYQKEVKKYDESDEKHQSILSAVKKLEETIVVLNRFIKQ